MAKRSKKVSLVLAEEERSACAESNQWVYYVKRSVNPSQVIYTLTNKVLSEYCKDDRSTEHNSMTVEELEEKIQDGGRFYQIITDAFKEATKRDPQHAQTALFTGIKERTIESLNLMYPGLKAVTLSLVSDPQYGTISIFQVLIACSDGTYDLTVRLLKTNV